MNRAGETHPPETTNLCGESSRRLLVVVPEFSAGVRIAYDLPFRLLERGKFIWRVTPEYYLKYEDLAGINLLILYRCLQGSTLSLVRLARANRIKVLYELDDDLLEPPEDESWGRRYRQGQVARIIGSFLTEADFVKAGSPELAHRLTERGYPAVYQPYTAKVCEPSARGGAGRPYRVGYFGSPHHRRDIEAIFPALREIKEGFHEEVMFEFYGCFPEDWRSLKAETIPYEPDYELFLDALAGRSWDLGLAPLRRTSFNMAKSDGKFRDYTAAGILGVYSDLAPYRSEVIDGQNGWLAGDSPENWYEKIKEALASTDRFQMFIRARELFQEKHSPALVAANWYALIEKLAS